MPIPHTIFVARVFTSTHKRWDSDVPPPAHGGTYQIPIHALLVSNRACLLLCVCASLAVCLFSYRCANVLLACLLPIRLVIDALVISLEVCIIREQGC
jgi:hypothetical protein